jgi:hypothetical protein
MKTKQRKLLVLAAICLLFTAFTHAQSPTVTVQAGYPVGRSANQVAYGNSTYVLLTSYSFNLLFQSATATTWSPVNATGLATSQLNFITFGAGVFVVIGNGGVIQTSTNGTSWTTRTSGTTSDLYKIYFVNSKFFAIGTNRTLLTSTDGITWTAVTFNAGSSSDFFMSLAYGNGWYVLSARNNSGSTAIVYRSSTAANNTWSAASDVPSYNGINRIQFLNNKFWAFMIGNRMFTSADGSSWTEITNSIVLTQPNSTTTTWNSSHQIFNGVWDGTKYSFYGSSLYYGGYGSTFTSTDGINFTLLTKTAYIVPQESTILNGTYFVCGNEGIVSSTNGLTYAHSGSSYRDMAKTANKYVSVGMISSDGQIYNSTDFNTWTNRSPAGIRELYTVAYDGSNLLAAGYINVLSSTNDGDSWTNVYSNNNVTFTAMAYGNSRFVSGGYDGSTCFLNYSTNGGATWTTANSLNYSYNKIKYINNRFFALGSSNDDYTGRIMYSTDGISWTDVTPNPGFAVYYYKDVTFDGTKYHILGMDDSEVFFTLSTSTPATAASYGNKAVCSNTPAGVTLGGTWDEGLLDYSSGKFTGAVIDINSGQDYIITSTDGASWTALPQNSYSTITASYLNGQTVQQIGRNNALFTVSYGGTLPVSFLSFDGSRYNSSVKLNWVTAVEKNASQFMVQHSADGIHWETIGAVKATGNNAAKTEYSFIHTDPLPGANFYRLLQQDIDGASEFSRLIRIYYGSDLSARAYPNPAVNEVTIHTGTNERGIITLFNLAGQAVKRTLITGYETRIDLPSLPAGTYMADIKQGQQRQQLTIVKK